MFRHVLSHRALFALLRVFSFWLLVGRSAWSTIRAPTWSTNAAFSRHHLARVDCVLTHNCEYIIWARGSFTKASEDSSKTKLASRDGTRTLCLKLSHQNAQELFLSSLTQVCMLSISTLFSENETNLVQEVRIQLVAESRKRRETIREAAEHVRVTWAMCCCKSWPCTRVPRFTRCFSLLLVALARANLCPN